MLALRKQKDGMTDLDNYNKQHSQLSINNIIKLSLMFLQHKSLARFVPCMTFHPPGPTLTTMSESQAGFFTEFICRGGLCSALQVL